MGKGVRILSAGVPVATVKGKDIVPSPELALSLALREGAFPDAALAGAGAHHFFPQQWRIRMQAR